MEFYKNVLAKVLQQSHQVWSYKPMNFYPISWTLMCMSWGGYAPPNSYICHYYIFIFSTLP